MSVQGRFELVEDAQGQRHWRGGNVECSPTEFRVGERMDFAVDAWPPGTVINIAEPRAPMTTAELRDIFPDPKDVAVYANGANVDMRNPDDARTQCRLQAESMWRQLANDTKPTWRVYMVAEPVDYDCRASDAPPWPSFSESMKRLAKLISW